MPGRYEVHGTKCSLIDDIFMQNI